MFVLKLITSQFYFLISLIFTHFSRTSQNIQLIIGLKLHIYLFHWLQQLHFDSEGLWCGLVNPSFHLTLLQSGMTEVVHVCGTILV